MVESTNSMWSFMDLKTLCKHPYYGPIKYIFTISSISAACIYGYNISVVYFFSLESMIYFTLVHMKLKIIARILFVHGTSPKSLHLNTDYEHG